MTKKIRTRNTVSGQIGEVPAHYLEHPVLGRFLVEVDEDAKPVKPELNQPQDAEGNRLGDDAKPVEKKRTRAPKKEDEPKDEPAPALLSAEDANADNADNSSDFENR